MGQRRGYDKLSLLPRGCVWGHNLPTHTWSSAICAGRLALPLLGIWTGGAHLPADPGGAGVGAAGCQLHLTPRGQSQLPPSYTFLMFLWGQERQGHFSHRQIHRGRQGEGKESGGVTLEETGWWAG